MSHADETDARMARWRIGYLALESLSELPAYLGHSIYIRRLHQALCEAGHEAIFLNPQDGRIVSVSGDTRTPVDLHVARSLPLRAVDAVARRASRAAGGVSLGIMDGSRLIEAAWREWRHCDLLHEHFGLLSWGGLWAQRLLGLPYVLHVHSDDLEELRLRGRRPAGPVESAMRWQTRACYRAADAIVAVSAAVKHRLESVWHIDGTKIFALPNAVDERFFEAIDGEAMRLELGIERGEPVVVFVGSFHVWYDLRALVDAVGRVRTDQPHVRLVLVGDGDEYAAIEALVRANGLASAVQLVGGIAHERVPALLAAADVAVLPVTPVAGEFWCSPMKLFEYMAAGKAILASDAGQIGDILRHGESAHLVRPGDAAGLAAGLALLLSDSGYRRRIGDGARAAAHAFTWKRYVERLEGVYEHAVQHRRARPPGAPRGAR